jgi:hypothetical protein
MSISKYITKYQDQNQTIPPRKLAVPFGQKIAMVEKRQLRLEDFPERFDYLLNLCSGDIQMGDQADLGLVNSMN